MSTNSECHLNLIKDALHELGFLKKELHILGKEMVV